MIALLYGYYVKGFVALRNSSVMSHSRECLPLFVLFLVVTCITAMELFVSVRQGNGRSRRAIL